MRLAICILFICCGLITCSRSAKVAEANTNTQTDARLENHLKKAQEYLQEAGKVQGSLQNAYNEYEQAATVAPKNLEVREGLGITSYYLSAYKRAIKHLESIEQKSISVCYHLALSYQMVEEHDKAIVFFQQALKLDRQMVGIHVYLAKSFETLGNETEALNSYLHLVQRFPDKWHYRWMAGKFARDLEKWDVVVAQLQQVSQITGNYPQQLYYYLAEAYIAKKNFAEAERYAQLYANASMENQTMGKILANKIAEKKQETNNQ